MESQPQNPEFRNNPESFHPCYYVCCINSLQIIFHHESKHYLFVCLFVWFDSLHPSQQLWSCQDDQFT